VGHQIAEEIMRYQPLNKNAPDTHVAAVWPSLEALAADQAARPDGASDFAVSTAAPDVPAAVGGFIAASYAGLLAVFFAFFARSPLALFSIVICGGFVAIYFTIPRIFLAIEADPARRPTLGRFLRTGLDTATGRTGGKDALIQMMIVPVLVTLGLAAIGIIGKIYVA
jgi:hypothetical protein